MKKGKTKEKITARIKVNRSLWAEVKAKAMRDGEKAEDVAAELMALGLSVDVDRTKESGLAEAERIRKVEGEK